MENSISRELEWDDIIENDGQQQITLPEGDYDYKITALDRARHAGSEKIPPCNKAILTIEVSSPNGKTSVKCNLFLHSVQEWKLCQFFASIGQRKHGEPLRMNWNAVIGATGRCRLKIRKWTNDKGREYENNEIDEFYDPVPAPVEKPKFTPGEF